MAAAAFASAATAAAADATDAAATSVLCCLFGCMRQWHDASGTFLWGWRYIGLFRFLAPWHAGATSSNGWSTTTWPWTLWAILVTAATEFGASEGRSADGRPLRQQRTGRKTLAVGLRQCRRSSKRAAHSNEQDAISLACAQYCGGRGPVFGAARGISARITWNEEAILLLTRGKRATGAC